jgi:multidrug efflux system membrane fusion protein
MNRTDNHWIGLALGALMFFPVWGCNNAAHTGEDPLAIPRPAKLFTVADPGAGQVRTFPGKVQAAQTLDLAFRVGGPLVEFPVTQGQPVSKGKLIARIDPRDYRVRVHGLEAQLTAARAQLQQATLHFERVDKLYAKKTMAKSAYDQAWAAREVAEAQVKSSTEALNAAQLALQDTELRAPYDGIVAEKLVENYQNVKPGKTIVHFQETTNLEIVINLSERDVSALTSQGMKQLTASFDALPGRTVPVRVSEYGTMTDPQTRTFPVTLAIDPASRGGLLPGMTASVRWQSARGERTDAVTVPLEAVFSDEAGTPHVWRVRPESDTVEKVPVTAGTLMDSGLEVFSGLEPGDRVLAAGVHFIQEGQKVRPLSAGAGA